MTQTTTKTLDQRRAEHAWQAVRQLLPDEADQNQKKVEYAKEYQREARKLSVRVMNAGLGQALAFLGAKAKKKSSLKELIRNLNDWVGNKRELPLNNRKNTLIETVIHGDSDEFQMLTDETLLYVQWLNRFLEARLGAADLDGNGADS